MQRFGLNILMAMAIAGLGLGIPAGCTQLTPGPGTRAQAGAKHEVKYGTVQDVRPVTLQGSKSRWGSLGGAILGAALGSAIGEGGGQRIATAAGGVAGAAAGAAAQEKATTREGVEIVVDMEDGGTVSVAQESAPGIRAGDRVRVLTAPDGSARVQSTN